MTNTQIADNLMFVAALQHLAQLAAAKGMTELEIEKVNAAGGLAGRQIEMVIRDSVVG